MNFKVKTFFDIEYLRNYTRKCNKTVVYLQLITGN